ncbi:hypothetical protein BDV25DRAFT_138881 [Aspergillus avenaceus]|uniref:Uncharacterized protein n=1 Tax=Aspergillus avenaceus TaxID=36643 RepID=A0A5N6TYK5_ASPAV|nr:hypothetical protein BDV25DRAFT_138881 [Aspergillus avenaceus]
MTTTIHDLFKWGAGFVSSPWAVPAWLGLFLAVKVANLQLDAAAGHINARLVAFELWVWGLVCRGWARRPVFLGGVGWTGKLPSPLWLGQLPVVEPARTKAGSRQQDVRRFVSPPRRARKRSKSIRYRRRTPSRGREPRRPGSPGALPREGT